MNFLEFTYLQGNLLQKGRKWFISKSLSKKWCEIFMYLKENNVPCASMEKSVVLLMCLPGSNASVECFPA
jgi:hypothetical protein